MQRVICHWTAGTHRAGESDRQAYHFLIEGDGRLVRGVPSVAANSGRRLAAGYAAHTLNCNNGSIGVSLCCMEGAQQQPFRAGGYPMTRAQWETMVVVVAELCKRYRIKVTPRTVLSHAEVERVLHIEQKGKWDISRLAFDPSISGAAPCGDRLRREVTAAMASTRLPDIRPVSRDARIEVEQLLERIGEMIGRAIADGIIILIRAIGKRFK
ncbi:N-acetylmuramoyl-L-alanine amidase [Taklimakanibacter lacteus]|uniref:N-acetylmuramoyl-L-alanine amidase n=1 Tax=Taklimakanibacter lacteus TaxID=2268456 RepID=UPI0034D73C0B